MKLLLAVLLVTACKKPAEDTLPDVAVEAYRHPRGAVLGISASGTAVLVRTSDESYGGRPDDLELVERRTKRVIAQGRGRAIGAPDEGEAYAWTGNKLIALASKREVAIELPPVTTTRWELAWSTVDHASGTALLALREVQAEITAREADEDRDRSASRYELVEVDVKAMTFKGRDTISILGSQMSADDVAKLFVEVETRDGRRTYGSAPRGCELAAVRAQVYVTCRVPEADGAVEHWVATRYDGRKLAWSVRFETPPAIGNGDIATAVSGDGKTLLVVHGRRSYGLLAGKTTVLLDAATGTSRTVPWSEEPLGKLAELTPVPNSPLVIQVHKYAPSAHSGGTSSFHGISNLDTTTGTARVVLDTSKTNTELRLDLPRTVVALPNGSYVLGM